MVIISNVSMQDGKLMYMVDKVSKVEDKSVADLIIHLKKLSWILKSNHAGSMAGTSHTFSASSACTPYAAKKTRRLSEQPTGQSLKSQKSES